MSIQARWNVAPRLAGVPGVANVSIWGQRERQVQVLVDARNLLKKGVKLEQVIKTTGEAVGAPPPTHLESAPPRPRGLLRTPEPPARTPLPMAHPPPGTLAPRALS